MVPGHSHSHHYFNCRINLIFNQQLLKARKVSVIKTKVTHVIFVRHINPMRRNIMSYVDGFVVAVPTEKKEAYKKLALEAAAIFKEYGALNVVETWGDDVPEGKLTSFPMAVKLEPNETVVFSWVVWPNRDMRKSGMERFMADPRMQSSDMPFDGKRMIYGGFEVIVNE